MTDAALLTRAALLAAKAHAGQTRKGGKVPYVNHVIEVAHLVAEAGAPVPVVAAAFLHDVVEDSAVTGADIARDFGDEIAAMVADMTDPPDWGALPRSDRKRRQAAHMAQAPQPVRRIKIADQTSNVRDVARLPAGWTPADAADYVAGAALVVEACRGADPALEALFDAAREAATAATETRRL